MSFRPKLSEHVGTPKNMRFPRRWKRDDDLLCFSLVAAHEDFRGSVKLSVNSEQVKGIC